MKSAITRRQVALGLAAAMPAMAQAPATPQAPATAPPDDATAARERIRKNSEQLAAFSLNMATEPSFSFKP
jgi:hypothetical protein